MTGFLRDLWKLFGLKAAIVGVVTAAGTAGTVLLSSSSPEPASVEFGGDAVQATAEAIPGTPSARRPAGASYPLSAPRYSDVPPPSANDAQPDPASAVTPARGATAAANNGPPGGGLAGGAANAANASKPEAPKDPKKTDTSASTSTSTSADTSASGGGGAGTATSTSTSTSTSTAVLYNPPVSLVLTVSSTGWLGLCQRAAITLADSSGSATISDSTYRVTVTAGAGTLYEDAACTVAATAGDLVLYPGSSGSSRYFKSAAAVTASIAASTPGLASASATVTVGRATATLELGEPDMTTAGVNTGGVSASSVNCPFNAFDSAGRILVSDENNNRVLIWSSEPTANHQAADVILGQSLPTGMGANAGGLSASSLSSPDNVTSDGTRLFVADTGNNRVLIWNTIPTTTNQAADVVLGQPDMVTATDNNGGTSASSLSSPECVYSDGTRLFVCDANNNRILVWNTIPTTNFKAADIAIGQPDLVSNGAGSTASTLSYPIFLFEYGSQLFVSDTSNNRILVWNSIPTASGQAASFAVGQPDLTSSAANNGGLGAATLSSPGGVRVDGQGRLLISDYSNNRVLLWNQIPTASGAAADAVIGQGSMTTANVNDGGLNASSLRLPFGMSIYGSELWVADFANQRVLKYGLP